MSQDQESSASLRVMDIIKVNLIFFLLSFIIFLNGP